MSKITIDRSVLEQALTYLGDEAPLCSGCAYEWGAAIRVLRAALEQNHSEHCLDMVSQVEQEPVGCITGTYGGYPVVRLINPALWLPFGTALYTHPQPPRQPLMDEAERQCPYPKANPSTRDAWLDGWEAAEREHGIGGEA